MPVGYGDLFGIEFEFLLEGGKIWLPKYWSTSLGGRSSAKLSTPEDNLATQWISDYPENNKCSNSDARNAQAPKSVSVSMFVIMDGAGNDAEKKCTTTKQGSNGTLKEPHTPAFAIGGYCPW